MAEEGFHTSGVQGDKPHLMKSCALLQRELMQPQLSWHAFLVTCPKPAVGLETTVNATVAEEGFHTSSVHYAGPSAHAFGVVACVQDLYGLSSIANA